MLELLGDRTGNCLRVAVALEEAGLLYVQRRVDLTKGQQHQTAFLEMNPTGKVPTLVETGDGEPFVLSQSLAIMIWVAAKLPGRLMPKEGTREYATALERLFMVATDLIGPVHSASYLRRSADVLASRRLDGLVIARLGWMEHILRRHPYLAGDNFSLADIAGVTLLASIHGLSHWRPNPRISEWYARISARDGVVRGLSAFQSGQSNGTLKGVEP